MPSNYARPGTWTVSSFFYFLCFGVSLLFVCVFFFLGVASLTAKHIACRFSTTYLHRDEKSCWFDFPYKVYIYRFSMIKKKMRGLNPGATHNFEKNLLRVRWSEKDALLAAGSACQNVPPAWHFSNIFQSSKLGCEKNCHPCMHSLLSVGQVNIWDMKMLQLAYRSGHSLSEKEQMFNGSILLYWFTSCNFMKLKFDKRDINFKSAKDVASKTLLCFPWKMKTTFVVVMVTWFGEASRTHGQCERSLLPSKGAHHCLSCLWQDWCTAANVA